MSDWTVFAPLAGWVTPLGDVPDPVFAEKMLGDGLAIDPVNDALCAPCDATVLTVHEAGHVTAGIVFGANPGTKPIRYAGIPFFAVTHDPVTRSREFVISSAGFWMVAASIVSPNWSICRRIPPTRS